MITTVVLETPELGDRTYLLHDGEVAVVIDPQRDIDRVIDAAFREGVRIVCVADTHIHNDYVSGGWSLSALFGVPYLVAAGEMVSFARQPVRDGDEITVGRSFSLRVVATPGHTPHHVAYVVLEAGQPISVCTGGSMLFGSTGRTDLFGNDRFAELARDQYRSVHKLGRLPDWINVLPTHGFGSFCSVGASAEVESSTIHQEKSGNLAFGADDEDSFVAELLSGVTAFPDYYRHMRSRNLRGAPTPDLSPPVALNEGQLHRASRSSAWVVDLRPRVEFAAAHLHRSVNIEGGPQFTTYLGWLLPADTPLVLMGTTDEQIARAQLDLARIGVDHVAGRYVGPVVAGVGGPHVVAYPVRGFADLAEVDQRCDAVALDVRRADEWASGHLDGAIHVPLHELAEQIDQLPQGTIWVHCAAGFRASIAASLLAREGRRVVLVNDQFASLTRANGTQTTLNARVGIEDAA